MSIKICPRAIEKKLPFGKDKIMDTYDQIIKSLRELVGEGKRFESDTALAAFCGVDPAFVHKHLRGKVKGDKIRPLLDFFGKAGVEMALSDKKLPIMRRIGANAPEMEVEGDDLVTVPVMAIAGTGPGQFAFSLEPIDHIPILREFIHPLLFVCKIEGDSMEPTVMSGAYVGAIPPERLHEGKMYVFYDEVLGTMVKRLYYDGPGKLVLVSDNKATPPVQLDARGYENVIVGEVLWVWQKFR